jgi:hypothetical protein
MRKISIQLYAILIFISSSLATNQVAYAQELNSFIKPTALSKRNLQGEQKIRFNKLESKGQFSLFEFVNVGKLAEYQQNSRLKLVP